MIIYGAGEVFFKGNAQAFIMNYTGNVRITSSPDNLIIHANRSKIIGSMIDGKDLPEKLFEYSWNFKMGVCDTISDKERRNQNVSVIGVDYWESDNEKWEDDTSLWGTKGQTYLIGREEPYDAHNIVVNNNIKAGSAEFYYPDMTPVPKGELIHIHSDGIAMSGGVHTEDSVLLKDSADTRLTRTRITTTTTRSTNISGGGY